MPVDLNLHRKNIYQYSGVKPCPTYGEDGVLDKVFDVIDTGPVPFCVEFGELRVLGSTSRLLRLKYRANAFYFSATYDSKSIVLNVLDIIKCISKGYMVAVRWFAQFPKRLTLTPYNLKNTFSKVLNKQPDLFVIDIDSFDYQVVVEVFNLGFRPRVFVVEYNPSLPYDKPLWLSYENRSSIKRHPRLYGASYEAWYQLFTRHEYALVHISGFCNLIWVDKKVLLEKSCSFLEPNIVDEITDTDEKVKQFAIGYCLPGFLPSWYGSGGLSADDLSCFETTASF